MLGKLLFPTLMELVEERDFRTLKNELSQLPNVDLADILADVDESQLSLLFRLLPKEKAAEVFEYLDREQQTTLLESLSRENVKAILEEMSVDDRTSLLDELPPQVASKLIELLSQEDRTLIQTLLNYPEGTVGRLVTPDYVALSEDMTVSEALDKIRRFGKDKETVYACYVIGPQRKLLGFISLRRLVISPLDKPIRELYEHDFVTLEVDTAAEQAVDMLRRYDLIAMPVVDRDGSMVGIVTFDDLMDVAEEEYREDMDRFAAVVPGTDESFLEEKITSVVSRRVPWLMGLLVVQTVAAFVLSRYEDLLNQFTALVFFLSALVATGGNTGTQSSAMVIRALATGEAAFKDIIAIVLRSISSGLLLAIVLGGMGFVIAYLVNGEPRIGLCVMAGLAVVVLLSNIAGSVLPLLLEKVGLDPALMSGPFISTIVDIIGLLVYLNISTMILNYGR